jgi:hypothetical protein
MQPERRDIRRERLRIQLARARSFLVNAPRNLENRRSHFFNNSLHEPVGGWAGVLGADHELHRYHRRLPVKPKWVIAAPQPCDDIGCLEQGGEHWDCCRAFFLRRELCDVFDDRFGDRVQVSGYFVAAGELCDQVCLFCLTVARVGAHR